MYSRACGCVQVIVTDESKPHVGGVEVVHVVHVVDVVHVAHVAHVVHVVHVVHVLYKFYLIIDESEPHVCVVEVEVEGDAPHHNQPHRKLNNL